MTAQDQINKLKKLPPLVQQVCATCDYLDASERWDLPMCRATCFKASWTYEERCRGKLWAPKQKPVGIFVRFKRWLIG